MRLPAEEDDPFLVADGAPTCALDGLWLRRGHSDVEITVEDAQRLLTDFTRASLGADLVKKLAKRRDI